MKTRIQALVYLIMFTLILGAIVAVSLGAKRVEATVEFDPDVVDLEAPGWTVKNFVVTVWFKKGPAKRVYEIDPKTVLVDGVLGPKGGWKHTWVERDWELKEWVFRFKVSRGLIDLIVAKIPHMGIPGERIEVPLTVTGNFYDGTPFQGTGYMTVLIPWNPGPNPP